MPDDHEALHNRLNEAFGIALDPGFDRVTGGVLSENHTVHAGGTRYFLKKYRFEEERVRQVHRVKLFFAERGIPVIVPVKQRDGTRFVNVGGVYYSLFPFVGGVQYPKLSAPEPCIESAAVMLAKIHSVGRTGFPTDVRTMKPRDIPKFYVHAQRLVALIKEKKTHDDFDDTALAFIELKMSLSQLEPWQDEQSLPNDYLIHGDYHDQNLFFNERHEVTHVFDWEKTIVAPRAFEVVRAMHFICIEESFSNDRLRKAGLFLASYAAANPISPAEFRRGMRMYVYHELLDLGIEEWHYLEGNNRADEFLANDLAEVRHYADHFDEVVDALSTYLA